MARFEIWISENGWNNLSYFSLVDTIECTGSCEYSLTGLSSDTRYWIMIREVQGTLDEIKGAFSTPIELRTLYIPPNGWIVKLSTDGINFNNVATVTNSNTYFLTNLNYATTYYSKIEVAGFNEFSNTIEFTTLENPSTTLGKYDELDYNIHIAENSVRISTDNQLIINEINGTYYNRYGLLNRNDFIDNSGEFKYIYYEAEYPIEDFILITRITNEDSSYSYEYGILEDINIGNNINKIQINELVSLIDDLTGYEILGKIIDFDETAQTVDIYLGYEYDRALQVFGKTEYLYNNGYNVARDFTLKILRNEMPIITKYTREINGEARTESLLPEIPYEFYIKFDIAQSSMYDFTGLIEEIDNIYGNFTSTNLTYGSEINQNIPIYLFTNKLGVKNTITADKYTYYTSYDNSDIELKIEIADDNESNIKCTLTNKIENIIPTTDFTPISTLGNILEVDDLDNYEVGDCLILHEDNKIDPNTKDYYYYNSNNKYTITSMFEEDSKYYIILDGIYPLGNEQTPLKFKKYDYTEIIHLQGMYLRGNPVIQEEEHLLLQNQESIDAYGTKSMELTGKIVKKEDLSKLTNYLIQNFTGLTYETSKFIFPIEIVSGIYDFKPLDVIELEEPVYTGLEKQKMLILNKKVSRSMTGLNTCDRKEEYILFMLNGIENLVDNNVITIPKKNYTFLSDNLISTPLNTVDLNDNVLRFENKELGSFVIEKIPTTTFKGKTNSNLNFNDKLLSVFSLTGNLVTYNEDYINAGEQIVIRVNNEFIFAEGINTITSTDTTQDFKLILRDIFKQGQQIISKNQDVSFYKIVTGVGI
jgi:hypothetical protein